ncbi:unnamed protein product [Didymodactylos carnosus]|uniref:Retrotransposon gag domain-containing protein n=1 Tax=Didymodactylos carnosus TaxID=1234261 RepID=A0A814F4A8_9BILA|nr:unnamed protein product [Didymodactylos carnosus]CAF0975687.1 unnamed protein product [Didymodactylos carnosus]CAF3546111.1 unnamed protein product [Didymodactylos carnosus]CAF3748542.1 unnamed protein product [Didymodactylos carnosus]
MHEDELRRLNDRLDLVIEAVQTAKDDTTNTVQDLHARQQQQDLQFHQLDEKLSQMDDQLTRGFNGLSEKFSRSQSTRLKATSTSVEQQLAANHVFSPSAVIRDTYSPNRAASISCYEPSGIPHQTIIIPSSGNAPVYSGKPIEKPRPFLPKLQLYTETIYNWSPETLLRGSRFLDGTALEWYSQLRLSGRIQPTWLEFQRLFLQQFTSS